MRASVSWRTLLIYYSTNPAGYESDAIVTRSVDKFASRRVEEMAELRSPRPHPAHTPRTLRAHPGLTPGSPRAHPAHTPPTPRPHTQVDMVKTRMQGLAASRYSSTLQCVATVVRDEGLAALYKGLGMRCARVVPGQGIIFCTYEVLSKRLLTYVQR